MSTRLFVYGTLMHGQAGSGLLAYSKFLGEAKTSNEYALLNLVDFPGLVDYKFSETPIIGELYEVNEDILTLLDVVEGVPNLYTRTTITMSDGTEAETYKFKMSNLSQMPQEKVEALVIHSGNWRKFYV